MSARCSDCKHFELKSYCSEGAFLNCTKKKFGEFDPAWKETEDLRLLLRIAETCSMFRDIRLDETGAVLPEESQDG